MMNDICRVESQLRLGGTHSGALPIHHLPTREEEQRGAICMCFRTEVYRLMILKLGMAKKTRKQVSLGQFNELQVQLFSQPLSHTRLSVLRICESPIPLLRGKAFLSTSYAGSKAEFCFCLTSVVPGPLSTSKIAKPQR